MKTLKLKNGKTVEIESIEELRDYLNRLRAGIALSMAFEGGHEWGIKRDESDYLDISALPVWGSEIGDTTGVLSYDSMDPDYTFLLVSNSDGFYTIDRVSKNLETV